MNTKNFILKSIKRLGMVVCFALLSQLSFADPIDGEDPEPVPIDGGISILVAAGVAYGIKKVRDNRKQQRNEENK